ncbi:MAG: hypothetical protein RLZZ627_230 [Pseudomonadota bacterium]
MNALHHRAAMFCLYSSLSGMTEQEIASRHKYKSRLPIETHQRLAATMAKARYHFETHGNKDHGAVTWLGSICSYLDDIVQREYPSREELPNDVFFHLYYGRTDYAATQTPRQVLTEVLEILKPFEPFQNFDPRYARIVKFLESKNL